MRANRDNADAPTTSAVSGSPRPRIEWVDVGRGLAICLVVLYHAASWLDSDWWNRANLIVSSLRMPLFFALSGLFASKWLTFSWRRLFQGKVRLFVWVFLIWSVIGSCAFTVGVRVLKGQGSFMGTLVPILLSPVMPRLELWFIWALALFFCLAKLTRHVDPRIQLVVAGIGSAIALSGWNSPSQGWDGSVKYYFFFLVGLYGRALILRLGQTRSVPLLVGCFVAWLAVSYVLWHFDLRAVEGLYFLNCVVGLAGGVALSRAVHWALVRRIGSQTLPIYLAHTPVIIALCVLLEWSGGFGTTAAALAGPPIFMVLAVTITLWMSRVAPRLRMDWAYEPPRWFFGRERTVATAAEPPVPVAAGD